MRFIITSGATFERWDRVRGITNLSQGTTGAKIAEEALLKGHSVDYISNSNTKQPFEIKITPNNINDIEKLKEAKKVYHNYTFHKSPSFDDYLSNCLSVPEGKERTVFISSAAVSDYAPVKVNGKVSSIKEQLEIELVKLPKVIKEVKNKFPLMPIVGFKLLSSEDSNLDDLVEVAYKNLLESRMALIVANLVDENFRPVKTIIITPEKNIIPVVERKKLSSILVKLIEDRIDCDFYNTKIDNSFPNNIETEPFFNLIRDCSKYSLFSSYGEGRKGAEFGSIAMRTNQGVLTTGRGTTKKNTNEDNITLINDINEKTIFLSSNKIKATLNAPTLWYILQERPEINYIVHAHVYLPNGDFVYKESSPGTKNDYDNIESLVKKGSAVINQFGHGCLILLKEKDDLLEVLLKNGLYNSDYSQYYDIAYNRFEKGSLERSIENLNFDKDINVLDLACGTGKSALEIKKLGFNNLDIADASKDMLAVAEKRINKKGVIATFEDLSSITKTYDLITIRQAFSYLDRDKVEHFINGVHSKLNKDGYLIFNTFNLLPESIIVRNDQFDVEGALLKTLETNIINYDKIIHSQRTEYLDCDKGTYIPLYDINIFNQYDLEEVKIQFQNKGFEVDIIKTKKSACFVARKL